MKIGETAKTKLEHNIGLTIEQIGELSIIQERELVKSLTGRTLSFSTKQDDRMIGRGNPLLARKKFTTIEEINKKIDNLRLS